MGFAKPDDFCSSTQLLVVSVIVKAVRVQLGSTLCLSVKEEYMLSWKHLKRKKKERKALKLLNNWVKEITLSSQWPLKNLTNSSTAQMVPYILLDTP